MPTSVIVFRCVTFIPFALLCAFLIAFSLGNDDTHANIIAEHGNNYFWISLEFTMAPAVIIEAVLLASIKFLFFRKSLRLGTLVKLAGVELMLLAGVSAGVCRRFWQVA